MAKSDDDRDGRNPMARGYVLANRASSIGLQMAVPPLIGWWADGKFHTEPWCLIAGAVFGFAAAMLGILKLVKDGDSEGG